MFCELLYLAHPAVLTLQMPTSPGVWRPELLGETPSSPFVPCPHLKAAGMDNFVADTALHELLLKVLGLLVLIHLSTEGTCDRVRQSGLQENTDKDH